jgi:hypothetical protein
MFVYTSCLLLFDYCLLQLSTNKWELSLPFKGRVGVGMGKALPFPAPRSRGGGATRGTHRPWAWCLRGRRATCRQRKVRYSRARAPRLLDAWHASPSPDTTERQTSTQSYPSRAGLIKQGTSLPGSGRVAGGTTVGRMMIRPDTLAGYATYLAGLGTGGSAETHAMRLYLMADASCAKWLERESEKVMIRGRQSEGVVERYGKSAQARTAFKAGKPRRS